MRNSSFFSNMPPVTKNLIIINFIIWLAMIVSPDRIGVNIENIAGLHYFKASEFYPWQLLTYMFLHSTQNFAHLLFNMFTLFMFGITIERVLGSARFLFYYVACGIGAAFCQEAAWAMTWEDSFVKIMANSNGVDFETVRQAMAMGVPSVLQGEQQFLNMLITIGASGAIYGVLLAFGMLFPNRPLYLMFVPIPIKAKWMVIGYGVIELLIGVSSAHGVTDGVAHWAHLGGMIFGFFMIYYWKKCGAVHGDGY